MVPPEVHIRQHEVVARPHPCNNVIKAGSLCRILFPELGGQPSELFGNLGLPSQPVFAGDFPQNPHCMMMRAATSNQEADISENNTNSHYID
jgi:hypothetical protein